MSETSFLPVLEPDKAEIVDLDHLQPLGYRVKDKLDPILRQLDGEVVGQGVPVTVRYLHSLVEGKQMRYCIFKVISSDHPFLLVLSEIGFAFCLLLQSRSDRLCLLRSRFSCARKQHNCTFLQFLGVVFPHRNIMSFLDGVSKTSYLNLSTLISQSKYA